MIHKVPAIGTFWKVDEEFGGCLDGKKCYNVLAGRTLEVIEHIKHDDGSYGAHFKVIDEKGGLAQEVTWHWHWQAWQWELESGLIRPA
jgi:hypothetical protein